MIDAKQALERSLTARAGDEHVGFLNDVNGLIEMAPLRGGATHVDIPMSPKQAADVGDLLFIALANRGFRVTRLPEGFRVSWLFAQ